MEKELNRKINEAYRGPNAHGQKRTSPQNTTVKFQEVRHKNRILKVLEKK